MQLHTSLLLLLFATLNASGQKNKLMKNTSFASVKKATELLSTEDSFTAAWSQFDIDARMGKKKSTKEELLAYAASQVLPWTTQEKTKMKQAIALIAEKINDKKLQLDIPETIHFIKTTAQEEGGAQGYTRANYIVVKNNIESMPMEKLSLFIAHELFHVLSRHNKQFRASMYDIIGFKIMEPQLYPNRIKNKRITNPDATQTDCYIPLKVNGKKINCMMILYADREYTSGHFFEYLNVGFLEIDPKKIKPEIYTQKEVSNFFEQVGRNTKYIIHPEEIMADNFSYLLFDKENLPDAWLTNAIQKKLQK